MDIFNFFTIFYNIFLLLIFYLSLLAKPNQETIAYLDAQINTSKPPSGRKFHLDLDQSLNMEREALDNRSSSFSFQNTGQSLLQSSSRPVSGGAGVQSPQRNSNPVSHNVSRKNSLRSPMNSFSHTNSGANSGANSSRKSSGRNTLTPAERRDLQQKLDEINQVRSLKD